MKRPASSATHTFAVILSAATLTTAVPTVQVYADPVAKTTKNTTTAKKSKSKTTSQTKKSSSQSKKGSSQSKKQNSSTPKTAEEARRQQEAAQKEIARTKEELRLNEKKVKEGLADLNQLQSEINVGKGIVADLEKKVNSLQSEMSALSEKIESNEKDLARMREEYLKVVKKMRLTKKNQSTLAFVFSSDNFNQALRRVRYLRQYSEWKDRKSKEIDSKIESLKAEQTRLEQVKAQETQVLGQLQTSQRSLEQKHQRQGALVAELRRNGDILQNHLHTKQQEANSLKQSISALIAQEEAKAEAERKAREKAAADKAAREKAAREKAEREKAEAEKIAAQKIQAEANQQADREAAKKAAAEKKAAEKKAEQEKKEAKKKAEDAAKKQKNSEKGSRKKGRKDKEALKAETKVETPVVEQPKGDVAKPMASNFGAARGSLPRPVDGSWRITNPFGRHSMPDMPDVVYDNPGIDAEVTKGASAKAVYGGKVSGVYKVSGYGTVVIVNHGEYYTVYGNLSSVNVSVGTQVKQGQTLGTVGADPDDPRRSSVHFEVWKGREKLNPSNWIR